MEHPVNAQQALEEPEGIDRTQSEKNRLDRPCRWWGDSSSLSCHKQRLERGLTFDVNDSKSKVNNNRAKLLLAKAGG